MSYITKDNNSITYSNKNNTVSFTIPTGEDDYYEPQVNGVNDNLSNIGNSTVPTDETSNNIVSNMEKSNKLKETELKLNIENSKLNATLSLENTKNLQTITKLLDSLLKSILSNTMMIAEQNRINEASQILQSEQYIVSTEIKEQLKELVKATKEQQLNFNADSFSMGNVSIDTTDIKNALLERNENQKQTNEKILEGIDKQNKVNEKLFEKLNLELDKNISYGGTSLNKIELENKKNLEILTSAKNENDFSLDDGLELLDDFLSDGFDIDINPFEIILDELKKEFETDSNEIKIKYNLKEELK